MWYKVKRIRVGTKMVRPYRFEYEYDFRNKTTTQLANDWWTNTSWLVTWSDWISYNGWHQCMNTVSWLWDAISSAKKITLYVQTYMSSTSNPLAWLALFHDTNWTAESWFYYDNTNFVVNANASIVYSQTHSKSTWIKNITCVFDLVNKTYYWNYVWGNGAFSGTLTDSQITAIRTCWIARLVIRLYSYTQTIKITVV